MLRLILVLAALLLPAIATAQESDELLSSPAAPEDEAAETCIRGRVRVEDSCCWPGQHVVDGVCAGTPECPEGTTLTDAPEQTCKIPDRAAWYEEACEEGSIADCLHLAIDIHYKGRRAERNIEANKARFDALCAENVGPACHMAGWFYHNGVLVDRDFDKARKIYEHACAIEELYSCNCLGYIALAQNDREESFRHFDETCAAGDDIACINLAFSYAEGRGIEKDSQRGLKILKEGCERSRPYFCLILANHYAFNDEVQDGAAAIALLKKPAKGAITWHAMNSPIST